MNRTTNTLRNIKFAAAGQILGILVNFISRKVFVLFLSVEYLGLNGLFSNILSMLTLTELGVGTAIIYSLYKPIGSGEKEEIKTLLRLYKRIYFAVGMFVLAAGCALTPFLHIFVKDMPDIPHIRLIYIIFVVNTAVSYFFTYNRSIIIANQKQYIVTLYHYGLMLLLNIAQIVVLYLTQNFILYLLLQTINTISENVLLSKKAGKLYPYIKERDVKPLRSEVKAEIKKNTFAMVFHRLGGVVVFATDNILISKLVGLIEVGLYSNYMLIRQALNTIISQLFQSVAASFGSLNVQSTDSHKLEIFNVLNFIGAWIFGFCSICLIVLINPFVTLWLGEEYLFPITTVSLIVIVFYTTGMRQASLTVRDAMGVFWYDRYKPIFEVLINIIASILLGKRWGVDGILVGTIISTITTCFWIEPYVVYQYGFHTSSRPFFISYMLYTAVTIFAGALTVLACSLVPMAGIYGFIAKLTICAVIPNMVYLVCYWRTKEFLYIWNIIKHNILKIN